METNNIEQQIYNLKGKHVKNALTRIERDDRLTPQLRKIILDEFNDLARDILRALGYEVAD